MHSVVYSYLILCFLFTLNCQVEIINPMLETKKLRLKERN